MLSSIGSHVASFTISCNINSCELNCDDLVHLFVSVMLLLPLRAMMTLMMMVLLLMPTGC